jgi:hypothetical protein
MPKLLKRTLVVIAGLLVGLTVLGFIVGDPDKKDQGGAVASAAPAPSPKQAAAVKTEPVAFKVAPAASAVTVHHSKSRSAGPRTHRRRWSSTVNTWPSTPPDAGTRRSSSSSAATTWI